MAPDPSPAPQLTMIVAAWNASATIERAVESVLDEPDVPLECIVVDDGSTDDTHAIVAAMAALDARLVLLRSHANEGVSAARNRALEVARGEWLAFLDADDRLLPGGLATMMRAATTDEALVVVGQRISTDGTRTWVPALYDHPDIRLPGRKSLTANPGLLYYIGPVGKLYHRSCVAGRRFDGRMLGDQPWVIRALMAAGDRITVIDDVVYEWRRPPPDRYVPTITTRRERSARVGAEAVGMAGSAFKIVAEAFAGSLDPAAQRRLEVTYFDRLLRSELSPQISGALRSGDPELALLFEALAAFIASVPRDVVAGAGFVAQALLEPPLRRWHRLPASARAAYHDLVRVVRSADPRFAEKAGGWLPRVALRLGSRLPAAIGDPLAASLVMASRVPIVIDRRLRPEGALSPAPDGPP